MADVLGVPADGGFHPNYGVDDLSGSGHHRLGSGASLSKYERDELDKRLSEMVDQEMAALKLQVREAQAIGDGNSSAIDTDLSERERLRLKYKAKYKYRYKYEMLGELEESLVSNNVNANSSPTKQKHSALLGPEWDLDATSRVDAFPAPSQLRSRGLHGSSQAGNVAAAGAPDSENVMTFVEAFIFNLYREDVTARAVMELMVKADKHLRRIKHELAVLPQKKATLFAERREFLQPEYRHSLKRSRAFRHLMDLIDDQGAPDIRETLDAMGVRILSADNIHDVVEHLKNRFPPMTHTPPSTPPNELAEKEAALHRSQRVASPNRSVSPSKLSDAVLKLSSQIKSGKPRVRRSQTFNAQSWRSKAAAAEKSNDIWLPEDESVAEVDDDSYRDANDPDSMLNDYRDDGFIAEPRVV